jgi:hypothetical protein
LKFIDIDAARAASISFLYEGGQREGKLHGDSQRFGRRLDRNPIDIPAAA